MGSKQREGVRWIREEEKAKKKRQGETNKREREKRVLLLSKIY